MGGSFIYSTYTNSQNHSRCIKAATVQVPGSIHQYVTGASKGSQRRDNAKDAADLGIDTLATQIIFVVTGEVDDFGRRHFDDTGCQ